MFFTSKIQLNTTTAQLSPDRFHKITVNFLRRPRRKTLEREFPLFLNLLKITTEAGMSLPQSIKILHQSSETFCPHLVEGFAAVLHHAEARNLAISDALTESSRETQSDLMETLMKTLAIPATDIVDQLTIINVEILVANTMIEKRCLNLRKNYWRRWLPHVVFFLLFVMPLIICPMLGPALGPSNPWAIGPNDYGIIPR